MAELSQKQKREWAQQLYVKERISQKEIASKVGSTEKTISAWKEKYQWDKLKVSILLTRQEELSRLYAQLNELNTYIESKQAGFRFANSKEGDTIGKLTKSIKSLEIELSIAAIIDSFISFNEWLRTATPDKAKEIVELEDEFIKSRIS